MFNQQITNNQLSTAGQLEQDESSYVAENIRNEYRYGEGGETKIRRGQRIDHGKRYCSSCGSNKT
jgi:hypothetical protein